MGARMAVTRRYSQSEFERTNYSKLKKCSAERFKVSLLNGPNGGKNSEECSSTEFEGNSKEIEEYDREYITSYGSKPGVNLIEWANQNFDAPLPVKMELSPIINLFTKAHFSGDDDTKSIQIENILQWLVPLYYSYCNDFKSELGIKSCDPPKERCGLNDNCIPGEEVCNDKPGDSGYECCRPHCKNNPCENDGKCTDIMDIRCDFTCSCTNGWKGKRCNERVVVKEILAEEIRKEMRARIGVKNKDFAEKLFFSLSLDYPRYTFVVNSYNEVSGFDNHIVMGEYFHEFRTHGRNIVVGWTLKTSPLKKSVKEQLQRDLLSETENANLDAEHLGKAIRTWFQSKPQLIVKMVHVVGPSGNMHTCGENQWLITYKTKNNVDVVILLKK